MPDFSFDDDEPVKSYTKTKGNGAGCIWLSALAAILIPTAIFTVWMWVSYSNIKDAAAKASAENKAIEKRYPGANVAPEKEIRAYKENLIIIEMGSLSFAHYLVAANLVYLLLFIPYILIVMITAFCLAQAAKG